MYNWGQTTTLAFAVQGPSSTTGPYLSASVFDDYATETSSGYTAFVGYPNASSPNVRAQLGGSYPAGYGGSYSYDYLTRGADTALILAGTSYGMAEAQINLSWVLVN